MTRNCDYWLKRLAEISEETQRSEERLRLAAEKLTAPISSFVSAVGETSYRFRKQWENLTCKDKFPVDRPKVKAARKQRRKTRAESR